MPLLLLILAGAGAFLWWKARPSESDSGDTEGITEADAAQSEEARGAFTTAQLALENAWEGTEVGTDSKAYAHGRVINVTLVDIGDGHLLESDTADAFMRMRDAAEAEGITLKVNEAWRSMAQQQAFFDKFLRGGAPAAKPGYSNHQGGYAVDIATGGYDSDVYAWLSVNAVGYGFSNTVPGEPWHWSTRNG